MLEKWSGRVRGPRREVRSNRDFGSESEDDEADGGNEADGFLYEDIDDLKLRLLPTLTATYEQEAVKMPVQGGRVTVWRMPTEISQSRLAGRYKPSNACTIIAVKLAEYIYRDGITLRPAQVVIPTKRSNIASRLRFRKWPSKIFAEFEKVEHVTHCSAKLLNAFINAIIEGNEIHEQQMARRQPLYPCNDRHAETFTIPQALEGCGNVFREIEYATVRGKITHNLKSFVLAPIKSDVLKDHLQIYMILIVFERSILLVYERECNAIFLIDTHTHLKSKNMKTGGLIAMCSLNELDCLIKWMCKNIFPETTCKLDYDQSFEVSVIAFKGQLRAGDHPLFVPRAVEKQHIFPKRRIDQVPRMQLQMRSTKTSRPKKMIFT